MHAPMANPVVASPEQVIRATRALAAPITVLTVASFGRAHGMTASAVAAVSRTPLIITICLSRASTFGALLREQPLFSVNVLGAGQESVARWFANSDRPKDDGQFAALETTIDPLTGAPLIVGSLSHLSCQVVDSAPVGDHDQFLANVIAGETAGGEPLINFYSRIHAGLSGTARTRGAS